MENKKKPLYFGSGPQNYYSVVNSINTLPFEKDYRKTAAEIETFVNTEGILKRIAFVFNDLTLFFVRNGIEFDQIYLSTSAGLVCKDKYYDELKDAVSKECSEEELDGVFSKIPEETYSDVVPVSFKIDLENTGRDNAGIDIDNVNPQVRKKLGELEVNGLVHLNEFLVGLRDMGYVVDSIDGELFDYSDYTRMVMENKNGLYLSVGICYHNRLANNDGVKL